LLKQKIELLEQMASRQMEEESDSDFSEEEPQQPFDEECDRLHGVIRRGDVTMLDIALKKKPNLEYKYFKRSPHCSC
jgi:hypothetical protein